MTEINKEIEEMARIIYEKAEKSGERVNFNCFDCATALHKAGYRKQSEVLKAFIKQIEKKFGKSCSEEYQFTFIEMLSTELEELAEQYGKEDTI